MTSAPNNRTQPLPAGNDAGRASFVRLRMRPRGGGYGETMLIAGVIVFCVLLLILAFLAPRLSHGPQRGGHKVVGLGQRGAGKAPGKLGHWLSKPFHSAQKAIGKSGSAGRKGRGKMPL